MLLDLIVNFCILFSFAVLSYWPFQDKVRFRMPFQKIHSYVIGVMAGSTGFILMESSVQITDSILLISSRHYCDFLDLLVDYSSIISGIIIGLSYDDK
jgi:diguanylate cyclase